MNFIIFATIQTSGDVDDRHGVESLTRFKAATLAFPYSCACASILDFV